eukprot:1835930-Pleurochrysis_carterae.AAC.1
MPAAICIVPLHVTRVHIVVRCDPVRLDLVSGPQPVVMKWYWRARELTLRIASVFIYLPVCVRPVLCVRQT